MRSPIFGFLSVALTMGGCKEEEHTKNVLVPIDASETISIQLHDAVADGVTGVPVRQVNSYGIGVPGGSATIAVRGGATIPTGVIRFDAFGYADVPVAVPEGEIVELQVQTASNTDELGRSVLLYGIEADPPVLDLATTQLLPNGVLSAEWIVAADSAVAVGSDDEIWWVPTQSGVSPHQVADLPYAIDGIWGVHIDSDGVLDLAVWADTLLILLRGRPDGGFGWGGGFSAQDREVAGVTAADVNGDRLADLVVGITTDDDSLVEVWLGNGRWGFGAIEPLRLSYPLEGVTASDDDRDGDPDITVMSGASGVLRRYAYTDDGWVGGTPPEIAAFKAKPGSVLLPPVDLNDEGNVEIAVISPPEAGQQDLVFYVMGTPPTKYPLAFHPFHATVADVDGNGAQDIVTLEDDIVHAVRYQAGGEKFISQATLGLGPSGPIAIHDWNDDGKGDLAILNDGVTFRQGVIPDNGGWSVLSHSWRSYSLSLEGHTAIDDFDADGYADVVGLVHTGDTPEMIGWRFIEEDGLPSLQRMGQVSLDGGVMLLDMAHCGQHVYALVGTPESRSLFRVKMVAEADGWRMETGIGGKDVSGAYVACGRVTGSNNGFAVATTEGRWKSYRNDGTEVGNGELGVVGGIGFADTDGDGVDELVGCGSSDCEVLGVDVDNDGFDEVFRSGSETSVQGWGRRDTLLGSGHLTQTDLDRDGRLDVLSFDSISGTLTAHRGMFGGVAPALSWRTDRAIDGPAWIADVNGDGIDEVLTTDGEGKLIHTRTNDPMFGDEEGDTGAP